MSEAQTGHGATFEREDTAGGGTFTKLAEVINITPPQISREDVEGTHLESPDKYNEYGKGMKDGGEPTITLAYFDDDDNNGLKDDLEDDDEHTYKVVYPDGSEWEFTGWPSSIEPSEIAVNERLTESITFRTTGKPEFSPVA